MHSCFIERLKCTKQRINIEIHQVEICFHIVPIQSVSAAPCWNTKDHQLTTCLFVDIEKCPTVSQKNIFPDFKSGILRSDPQSRNVAICCTNAYGYVAVCLFVCS